MFGEVTGKLVLVFRRPVSALLITKQPQKETVSSCFSRSSVCVRASNLHRAHWSCIRIGSRVAMQRTVYISVGKATLSWCTYISRRLLPNLHLQQTPTLLSLPFPLRSIYNPCGCSLTRAFPFTAVLSGCSSVDLPARRAPAPYYYRGHWNIPGHQYVPFSPIP